jgi:two-component system, NtrC family, response regulator GlrR
MKSYPPPDSASLGFGLKLKASKLRKGQPPSPQPQKPKARILVVDNDQALCRLLTTRLGAANYQTESANSARAAIDACARSRPDLVITDLRMEHVDGLALLKELKSRWPELSVIILTAHGTIPEAVQATQSGAFGFLVKPIEKVELLEQVQRAIAASTIMQPETNWQAHIISRSQLMQDRLMLANKAAHSSIPVLLSGESGTGKELFARAIHAASSRREKPFIVVTCRGPGDNSLESELFGAGDDASVAADSQGGGAFQAARGGTLLLNEIGDLSPHLQVKLAKRLSGMPQLDGGPSDSARADVRLICATSRDLRQLLNEGQFHDDLYYRINVLPIEVPALGRRREDIPLLIESFLAQATEQGEVAKIYSRQAVQLLVTADWPGNVRQLFDLVKQNVALSPDQVMTETFVQQSLGSPSAGIQSFDDARDAFSREYLIKNLHSTSGNVSQSARIAKRNRTDFYKLLLRYRVQSGAFKKKAAGQQDTDNCD